MVRYLKKIQDVSSFPWTKCSCNIFVNLFVLYKMLLTPCKVYELTNLFVILGFHLSKIILCIPVIWVVLGITFSIVEVPKLIRNSSTCWELLSNWSACFFLSDFHMIWLIKVYEKLPDMTPYCRWCYYVYSIISTMAIKKINKGQLDWVICKWSLQILPYRGIV